MGLLKKDERGEKEDGWMGRSESKESTTTREGRCFLQVKPQMYPPLQLRSTPAEVGQRAEMRTEANEEARMKRGPRGGCEGRRAGEIGIIDRNSLMYIKLGIRYSGTNDCEK